MTRHEQAAPQAPFVDKIDFRGLFRVLWAGKWLIGGATVVSGVAAVIFALMLPNVYQTEVLLAPNQERGADSMSALVAQYGGLASLAGINPTSLSSDKTTLGLEILKSRKFLSDFIQNRRILVPLMASDGWDAEKKTLDIDPTIYDESAEKWVRKVRAPKTSIPSVQEAYKKFREENFFVSQDKKNGFVTIVIEHHSPVVAKQWADWLVGDLNDAVMRQDVAEAEQAIAFLKEQVAATSLSDLQNVFFRLIEEQTKIVMLAKVSPEYLFRTVDPAIEPEQKAKPKRALIAALGLLLGAVIGVAGVLTTNIFSSPRK